MTKDVMVSIRGLQYEGNEENPIPVEVINPAQYYFKNDSHYILYDEISQDFPNPTKNRMKIKKNAVEISKKGASTVLMRFETDKKMQTYYQTPYGSLLLSIYTHRITFTEKDDELTVAIEYELEIDSNPVSDCQIKICVTPKGTKILADN